MFYFIPASYQPNVAQAAINRCKAYLRGFSELGVDTNVICYDDSKKYSESPLPHVSYVCYNNVFKNKWFSYISQTIFLLRFLFKLRKGDTVFCYGSAWLWYQILRLKKGVNVYVEYTEKPEVTGIGGKFLTPSYENFYKACAKLDGMFVISTALKEWFVSKGVNRDKIHIINVIVDFQRFEGVIRKTVNRYVAYCGTASNNKDGVDQLIKSFAIVSKKHSDVSLYIIGRIPDENQAFENAALVKDLGLERRVVFTGIVNPDLMPQMLVDAEVLALARPDNEQARYGFATKIGEYLLSGRPVVLTDVGDFKLFMKDGVSAYLAEPDNIDSFANKLDLALSKHLQADEVGLRGKSVALESFNYLTESRKIINAIKI